MKSVFTFVALILILPSLSSAQDLFTPAKGSPERKEILDAIRPHVELQLGKPVEFVVDDLKVAGAFSFAQLSPQRPGGKAIDRDSTPYAREAGVDAMEFWDCCHTEAILEKVDDTWIVRDVVVGSTDVWYMEWCEATPAILIGACSYLHTD